MLKNIDIEINRLENKMWYLHTIKSFLYIKGITCLPDKSVYDSMIKNLVIWYKNSNDKTTRP